MRSVPRTLAGCVLAISNAAIADKLLALAHFLADQKGNAFRVKAWRRAARTIRTLGESFDELVRNEADLTQYPGIGSGIASAIREIVQTGTLRQLETLRSQATPERAAIAQYPGLDAKLALRIFRKLGHRQYRRTCGTRSKAERSREPWAGAPRCRSSAR